MLKTMTRGLIAATAVSVLLGAGFSPGVAGASSRDRHHPLPVRVVRHHGHVLPLTAAQEQCLVDHGITRPGPGKRPGTRPDPSTIAAFRAALTACGITVPAHDHHHVPTPPTPPPTDSTTTTSTSGPPVIQPN